MYSPASIRAGQLGARSSIVGGVEFVSLPPPQPPVSRQLLPQLTDYRLPSAVAPPLVGRGVLGRAHEPPTATASGRVAKAGGRAEGKGAFMCPVEGCHRRFSKKVRRARGRVGIGVATRGAPTTGLRGRRRLARRSPVAPRTRH